MGLLVLFTDFGLQGPYVGLLRLAVFRHAPHIPALDLLHDAPPFDPQAAAYLLATYVPEFPQGSVFVGVVDPGVGGRRAGLILEADGRLFVGPDNGLFDRVAARAGRARAWRIIWKPERLSATFHGRDLFAPVAALLAAGKAEPGELGEPVAIRLREWPDDLARVIYLDRYGNAMTGIRAAVLGSDAALQVGEQRLPRARTFSDLPPGRGFWYENSSGLVELAVNQGSAAERLGLALGQEVVVHGTVLTVLRSR